MQGLSVDDPMILGPLAGFVFVMFALEVIVSGRAYRRLLEENNRQREVIEKVIPLSEAMVDVAKEMNEATKATTAAMERVLTLLGHHDGRYR